MLLCRSFVLPLDYHKSHTLTLVSLSGSLLLQNRQSEDQLSSKPKWLHIQNGNMKSTVSYLVYCNPIFGYSVQINAHSRVLEDTWSHPIYREGCPTADSKGTASILDNISTRLELRFGNNRRPNQFSVPRGRLLFEIGRYRQRNAPFSARLLRHTAHRGPEFTGRVISEAKAAARGDYSGDRRVCAFLSPSMLQ